MDHLMELILHTEEKQDMHHMGLKICKKGQESLKFQHRSTGLIHGLDKKMELFIDMEEQKLGLYLVYLR